MGKHRRLKPDCPFITNPASSGNVPLNNVQPATSEVASNDLMNEQCRLATFTNWPVCILYPSKCFLLPIVIKSLTPFLFICIGIVAGVIYIATIVS